MTAQRRTYAPPVLRRHGATKCGTKGRWRIFIGKGHPWATKSGQQWRYRLAAMILLGRRLGTAEHVDHVDQNRENDHPENLRVILVDGHGHHHYPGQAVGVIAEHLPDGFHEYETPAALDVPF